MKALIPLTLAFALGAAAHVRAACVYPMAPAAPPDGNTATRDEMIAAKHDFDRFNGEMNVYLDCIKLETDTKSSPTSRKSWRRRTTPPSMICRRWWAASTSS